MVEMWKTLRWTYPTTSPTISSMGVASDGTLGHEGTARGPSTCNDNYFSVNFRHAEGLTATLCGCLSKHFVFCYSSCGYMNLVQCIISSRFVYDKE